MSVTTGQLMTRKKISLTAFFWHRRIGLSTIVLVIILAITGIMLNHTEALKLDESHIESSSLLNWYGLEPKGEITSYKIKSHIISSWDGQLFFNEMVLTNGQKNLHGAASTDQFIIVAFDKEIFLLTQQGEVIERLAAPKIFSNIKRLGLKNKRAVIETTKSLYYMADEQILDWHAISNEGIKWSTKIHLNKQQTDKLKKAFRGNGLTLERVILDLHSGRIFGRYGVYLMDIAAIALLWLSLSGLWIWWRRSAKQKQKHHYQKHHR